MRTSLLLWLGLVGCDDVGCPDGPEGCELPSPCDGLEFTCDAGTTEAYTIDDAHRPALDGAISLAAAGDVVLANEQVIAVIEALDHPHYIAPTGGNLIDLARRDQPQEALRQVFTATGLLPEDGVAYDTLDVLDEGDVKAVLLTGHLDGYPKSKVATRYEIRPCEPGVRVRTEVINGGPDPLSWFVTDAWYFGGRGSLPFTPGDGSGYRHPSFGLSTIGQAFRDTPYLATGGSEAPTASFAEVSCTDDDLSGFHSAEISAVGPTPAVVYPGDWLAFERFIAVGPGPSAAGGADLALEVRRQLFDEPYVTLTGTLSLAGARLDDVAASVTISQGTTSTPADARVPVTQVFPDGEGGFAVRVPPDHDYVVEVRTFGRLVDEIDVAVGADDATAAEIVLDAPATVTLDATVDGVPDHVLVFAMPADAATADATRGDFEGSYAPCAPFLGHPHGDSPACNRILVDGTTTIAMPPGTYDFFATAGPFVTLGVAEGVTLTAGAAQTVPLDLVSVAVQPAGTLAGDFHVHGSASFDAQIGDMDRARAFLASRVQVIATTEHDAAWDYHDAIQALGAEDRLALMVGTESTGHLLWYFRADSSFPRVTGHWNFWPVAFDADAAYNGPAWDERAEPGTLMTRQRDAGWDPDVGVAELNHPLGGIQFGRDYGWASAAGFDLTRDLEAVYDGTGQSLYLHKPDGADFSNADYHVQEVMNGAANSSYPAYRAFWFYLLDQGVVRGGVANSDSHSLTESVLGTPRTLVWTDQTVAGFDPGAFDADLKAGHAIGTNGPVIVAEIRDGDAVLRPALAPVAPSATATLHVEVTAVPWVPVDEVRVVVNGAVVHTFADLPAPADPLGTDGVARLSADLPLSDLLPAGTADAWLVIEAGAALPLDDDLDCDGIPDTGDNNGDGAVDWRDVATLTADPGVDCLDDVGPLLEPPVADRGTPLAYFQAVTPGGWPTAFTNPFVFDRDGGGFAGVPR